ncbi:hypothetical protein IVB30_32755 [Bradyrhizobium sp. 200]|uniref:hypothetical protein n=1 Tax=Bradyrhizobium sp. 200 TaxID=2782665 RepID=UPI00200008D1|nr:hypothetical protein [Bradyrhizobium sp. 200]UPJ47912.1 hypothetical protein IVB30_32755 [Bradyrhizobium sp. 200]
MMLPNYPEMSPTHMAAQITATRADNIVVGNSTLKLTVNQKAEPTLLARPLFC